jgi:hypothetical protein
MLKIIDLSHILLTNKQSFSYLDTMKLEFLMFNNRHVFSSWSDFEYSYAIDFEMYKSIPLEVFKRLHSSITFKDIYYYG